MICPVCETQANTILTCPSCWAKVPKMDQIRYRQLYSAHHKKPTADLVGKGAKIIRELKVRRAKALLQPLDIDAFYAFIDREFKAGEFTTVDLLLRRISVEDCPVDALLAALTATLPAHSKLPGRVDFCERVRLGFKRRLVDSGFPDVPSMLRGLLHDEPAKA